jgi:hypothetical protein
MFSPLLLKGRTGMGQQSVERALGKLVTDEAFRKRFFANPETASWEAGLQLSPMELDALSKLSHEALVQLGDRRIGRAPLDPVQPETGKAKH